MNLYASGGMGSWNGRNGVQMSSSMQQKFAFTRGEPVYLVDYEERQDHKQPISFGLTLSYPLTKRLSVSTGAVYTKLSSDFLTIGTPLCWYSLESTILSMAMAWTGPLSCCWWPGGLECCG